MDHDDRTENLYAQRASLYERFFVHFLGWDKELENFFRRSNYLRPAMKILDVGCGTGIVTRTLYQLATAKGYAKIEWHAFDFSPNMLNIFCQWIERHDAKNIETQQANVLAVETLPLHWNEYDLIIVSMMLEYLPKSRVKEALAKLLRLLDEGGILLVFITKQNSITQLLARVWWKTNLFEQREISNLLFDAGFKYAEFKSLSAGWSNSIMAAEARR